MTKYENLINALQDKLNELDIEMRSFGKYKVELHSPLNPEEILGENPVHIAVDIYLHAPDPETKEDTSAVCWYAIEIYANKDCTEFASVYTPLKDNTFNYDENEYGEVLYNELLNLRYQPEFIELINDMTKEYIEKLKAEIAEL